MFKPSAHSLMFCCWVFGFCNTHPVFSNRRLFDIHKCCSLCVRMACNINNYELFNFFIFFPFPTFSISWMSFLRVQSRVLRTAGGKLGKSAMRRSACSRGPPESCSN